MTLPRDDDPYRGLPVGPEMWVPGRELVGLLLVIAGLAAGVWVLATVDWRWVIGVAAAAAVGLGVYLGRGTTPEDEED